MMVKLSVSLFLGKISRDKLTKIFIIIVSVLPIVFAIIVPPNQVPDEIAHFIRSYDISMGRLIPSNEPSEIPVVFEQLLQRRRLYSVNDRLELLSLEVNTEETHEFLSTSNYPFLIYLPQGIGLAIGRLFRFPAIVVFLLGRFLNAIACAVVLNFIAKKIPGNKWLLLMLFSTPMALYLAGSYSPDALTNMAAFLFLSLVFSYATKNGVFTYKQVIFLGLAAWLLALCKINIVPLALLLVLIPHQRFGTKRNKLFFLFGIFLVVSTTLVVWNSISPITPAGVREGVMPIRQLLYAFLNPITYLETSVNTVGAFWFFYLDSWFGNFGQLDASMPQLALLLYLGVLIYLAGSQDKQWVVSSQEKWVVAVTFAISIALTFLILYMVWTSYQADLIEGVQGRYLIPLMPLLFMLIPPFLHFLRHSDRYNGALALGTSLLIWIIALVVLTLRYYVPCGLSYIRDVNCALPAETWKNPLPLESLVEGKSLSQTFVSECDQMYRIDVNVSTQDRVNYSTLQTTFRKAETLEVIKEFVIENQSIGDQKFILFFDPISDSKGQAYELHIVSDADADNAVSLIATDGDQYPSGKLYWNGVAQEGDLQFKYYCHVGVQAIR